MRDVAERVATARHEGDQATVASHLGGISTVAEELREPQLPSPVMDAFLSQLRRAALQGRVGLDISSVLPALLQSGT